jgi:hypothetical protein
MGLYQNELVAPPVKTDESLKDFAEVIQRNMDELFQLAHAHGVRVSLPGSTDGMASDIVSVDNGTTVYLLVKTSRGWFRSAALTAI